MDDTKYQVIVFFVEDGEEEFLQVTEGVQEPVAITGLTYDEASEMVNDIQRNYDR